MDLPYDDKKCLEAKQKLSGNTAIRKLWRERFAPSNHVGNCSALYHKLNPSTTYDFFNKYVEYASNNHHLKIRDRGLTYYELVELAKKYKQVSDESTMVREDLSTYYYDILCHVIYETYHGMGKERDIINYLTKKGYKCEHFPPNIDTRYGADIKVTKSNGKVSAIQIKPIKFFTSNKPDVQKDRINLCRKYEELKECENCKTYYCIYENRDDSTWWVKNGDKFCFRINELFAYDKDDIDSTFTRKILPKEYSLLL